MNDKESKKISKTLPKLTIAPIVLTDNELKSVAGGGRDGEEGICVRLFNTRVCPCF